MWVVWDNEDKKKYGRQCLLGLMLRLKNGIVSLYYKPCRIESRITHLRKLENPR